MSAIAVPAPTGGWNARDSLAEMPPNDAVELINLIPAGESVKTRPGHSAYSNDLSDSIDTLVTYHGATEKMICCANGHIRDVSSGGAGTSLGSSFTSDRWYTTEFKNRIIFCNGADGVRDYDGSTLNTTSISGATSANLIFPVTHKGRVYYVEKDSQSFWYAGAGAYSGALTEYDLSEFTTTGGDLLTLISWSRDGGSGVDDLLACVFDTGEIIVYAGSDPGSATDWAMLGRFRVGKPLGRRSAYKIGGDVILLTVDGYVPLSAALQEGRYSEQSDFSWKIDTAVKSASQLYQDNNGWESVYWPEASLFIVNVPISSTEAVQFVRNTTTGGWCKFTGLDASCWTVYGKNLYFGSPDGFVYKISGSSDAGAFIPYKCVQAFTYFGDPHSKKVLTAVEPITDFNYPKYIDCRMYYDQNLKDLPDYLEPPEGAVADWDVGEWDVAEWTGSSSNPKVARKNLVGSGYSAALVLRFKSKAQTVTWWASHYWLKQAGIV